MRRQKTMPKNEITIPGFVKRSDNFCPKCKARMFIVDDEDFCGNCKNIDAHRKAEKKIENYVKENQPAIDAYYEKKAQAKRERERKRKERIENRKEPYKE